MEVENARQKKAQEGSLLSKIFLPPPVRKFLLDLRRKFPMEHKTLAIEGSPEILTPPGLPSKPPGSS